MIIHVNALWNVPFKRDQCLLISQTTKNNIANQTYVFQLWVFVIWESSLLFLFNTRSWYWAEKCLIWSWQHKSQWHGYSFPRRPLKRERVCLNSSTHSRRKRGILLKKQARAPRSWLNAFWLFFALATHELCYLCNFHCLFSIQFILR